jgi:GT2 family glycosyltransferase
MDVSVLIPVHNRAELTAICLDTLEATKPSGVSLEVIVYDDGSTDGTAELLASKPGVCVLRDADRGWFARNMNRMARAARGRYLVPLNNDVILRPGWLEPLLAIAAQRSDVGVIGNVQVYPRTMTRTSPGRCAINHAGIVFGDDGRSLHLYDGLPEALPQARSDRELQAVTGACWLMEQAFFEHLGGFDEAYRNGHEDLDLCFRAREAGRSVISCGSSVIEHHGGSSVGRYDALDANEALFNQRWGDQINRDARAVAGAEGVHWPKRPLSYRVARRVWRTWPTRRVLGAALATDSGVRARQFLLKRLVRTK